MIITLLRPFRSAAAVVDPTIDDILAKWQSRFPDLTGKELVAEALRGAEDEREEHGEGCNPDRVSRQHLWKFPYYYSRVLWPAERKFGLTG